MSLEKAIEHNKEYRKPYKGAARYHKNCRNNGRCNYCKSNRTIKNIKRLLKIKQLENENSINNTNNSI